MTTPKFFRFCFILMLVVFAAILVEGLIQPKDITVSRSTFIQAPKELVFKQMVHFKNWPNWSPWTRLDTSMKSTFSDNDSQAGSTYKWVGDLAKTGEVEIKNTSVEGSKMVFSFELLKPSHMVTSGSLIATDSAGGTKATFSFTNHFDYPWNAMTLFENIDNILSKDFEAGLKNMKSYIETHH
jgi:hypothetical protein